MGDQQIDMQKRQVSLILGDGSRLDGEVFLSLYDARHVGPQRLGGLLNGKDRFLPVETAEGVTLVNIARIACARTGTDQEAAELMRLGKKYRVRITTLLQEEIAADLYVNLPQTRQRVKDCLNQPLCFLPLFQGDEMLYLNLDYILRVHD